MRRPIDLHDGTLLALWVIIWSYPNMHPELQRDKKGFYEAAIRELKELYGIRMEDIKDDMEKEYNLRGPPKSWGLWNDDDDWRRKYV